MTSGVGPVLEPVVVVDAGPPKCSSRFGDRSPPSGGSASAAPSWHAPADGHDDQRDDQDRELTIVSSHMIPPREVRLSLDPSAIPGALHDRGQPYLFWRPSS